MEFLKLIASVLIVPIFMMFIFFMNFMERIVSVYGHAAGNIVFVLSFTLMISGFYKSIKLGLLFNLTLIVIWYLGIHFFF